MPAISTPKEGDLLQIGDVKVYVFDVEEDKHSISDRGGIYAEGRTLVTCHDDLGNEVEVWFYPAEEEDDE